MITFLKKLDRIAERFVNNLDAELQRPIVHAVTGEVFKNNPAPHRPVVFEARAVVDEEKPPTIPLIVTPERQPNIHGGDLTCEPILL